MKFTKSIQSNKSVQIYFDSFDNKYVRRGGTLAWRCNNPGLIRSHSHIALKYRPIGHCGNYPVFPDVQSGRLVLRSWLKLKSHFSKPLISIAQYYSPNDPQAYLGKLCNLSGLKATCSPKSLSKKEFEKLVWAIEKIAGANTVLGDEKFEQIPRIIGKFSNHKRFVDHYLIADQRILTKDEVIAEVKSDNVDAVIVRCPNGKEYLRSRPGHVLSQLYLNQSESVEFPDFTDLIRESGEYRKGQMIWGFINGIFNSPMRAKYNLDRMAKAVNSEHVWGMVNDTSYGRGFGLPDLFSMESGITANIVDHAKAYIRFLLSLAEKEASNPHVIIVAHSEGALIAEKAIKQLNHSSLQNLQVWTFGGAGFVPNGSCHPNSCNYINQYDLVARAASPLDFRLLIIRDRFKDKQLEFIADFLADEDLLAEGYDDGPIYQQLKEKRVSKYKKRLEELTNTHLIYHRKDGGLHHGFDDPNYHKKLIQLVDTLRADQ